MTVNCIRSNYSHELSTFLKYHMPLKYKSFQVMIDIFRDVSHSIDCDKDVTTEGESVNVKAWNTVNTVSV